MAKERTTFEDFAFSVARANWVSRFLFVDDLEPVAAPVPGIATHGVDAETVWGTCVDGATTDEAIFTGVLQRELALPNISHGPLIGRQFIAPRIEFLLEAAAGGVLPLCFGW